MTNPIIKRIELPDGRTITLETGKLAKQADGAVELRKGDTMLLATVCAAKDATPGVDSHAFTGRIQREVCLVRQVSRRIHET